MKREKGARGMVDARTDDGHESALEFKLEHSRHIEGITR